MININKAFVLIALLFLGCKDANLLETAGKKLNVVEWKEEVFDKEEHVIINKKFYLYGITCLTQFTPNKINKCFWRGNKISLMTEQETACAGNGYTGKDFSYCFNELHLYLEGKSTGRNPYAEFAVQAYGEFADEIGIAKDKIYFSTTEESLPNCLIITSDATVVVIGGSISIEKKKEMCKSLSLKKL